EHVIDIGLLEFFVREDLNKNADRAMVVMDPVKLIVSNYPEDKEEILHGENNPEQENGGVRDLYFTNELWIEREDFKEVPEKKYFRLAPGLMVRLKNAYIIKCESFKKDAAGKISEII